MDYLPFLHDGGPRYLALIEAISSDIQHGRLQPGQRLPGTRTLAQRLGLNRNTVVRAFRDLEAQGWVETTVGSGTRVRAAQSTLPQNPAGPGRAGFLLPPEQGPRLIEPPVVPYRFVGGQPDLRLAPVTELARAYRRALERRGHTLVDYGDPQGHLPLRRSLASWLGSQRGMTLAPDRLLITRGSQQALYLAAHTLFRPGDRIAVEQLGYRPAWEALRTADLELVPIPVDAEGMRIDLLPDGLRGVYLTPHHQYPTGAMLSAPRRQRLLDVAARQRLVVLEDDYDHEFHWVGSPVAPLAARDRHGVVVYLGTLSKALAPGLRIGWVAAPTDAIERMTRLRRLVDRQGDQALEHAIAALIEDGTLQRHIRRMHKTYAARRAHLLDLTARVLPELCVHPAPGGLALWCTAPGIDLDRWSTEALSRGVRLQTSADFGFDAHAPRGLRLGFAALNEPELSEGIARLAGDVPYQGGSCEVRRHGGVVHKRFPSPRGAAQAKAALLALAPERLIEASSRALRLHWLPGRPVTIEPEVHAAAGAWLRALHARPCLDDDPIPLQVALERRAAAALEAAAMLGIEARLPTMPDGQRVWCHRDFRPANWLWCEHQSADTAAGFTVIDFEHSRPDHPLFDLVKLALEIWPEHPELKRVFLAAYGPVDEQALAALVALFELQTRVRTAARTRSETHVRQGTLQ